MTDPYDERHNVAGLRRALECLEYHKVFEDPKDDVEYGVAQYSLMLRTHIGSLLRAAEDAEHFWQVENKPTSIFEAIRA